MSPFVETSGSRRITYETQPPIESAIGIGAVDVILDFRGVRLRVLSLNGKDHAVPVGRKNGDLCGVLAHPCVLQKIHDLDPPIPGIEVLALRGIQQEKLTVVRQPLHPLHVQSHGRERKPDQDNRPCSPGK